MSRKLSAFFEAFVTLAILAVLVHTFVEDFGLLAGWDMATRRRLVFAGFFFDLFFSVEFLVRLYGAIQGRRVRHYLLAERGWIDFLASVPLLLLNSGPLALALITRGAALGGFTGILSILKVVKSIRIARILRFLRVLKIFKNIKHADSSMAQRHIAMITSLSITILVFSLFAFTLIVDLADVPGLDSEFSSEQTSAMETLAAASAQQQFAATVAELAQAEMSLLLVRRDGETLYSRYTNEFYNQSFGPSDYAYHRRGAVEAYFDLRPQLRHSARESIFFFSIVILLVLAYILIYSPHFALTVTDPIHVMRRGIEDEDYNLEVKIPPAYENDDVFQLAKLHNEVFLPLKDRTASKEAPVALEMDLDDLKDLME